MLGRCSESLVDGERVFQHGQGLLRPGEVEVLGKGKKAQPMDITGGLKGVSEGADVTLTTERKDDKDQVTKVQVDGAKKKKKNNK